MQEKFTEKLFFGKYDHRVTVKCSSWNRQSSEFMHPAVIDYLLKGITTPDKFRVRHSFCYSGSNWRSKEQSDLRTYYFDDPALLVFFQEKMPACLEEVTRPKNKDHSEALTKERVLVRSKLFHNKYRYCIRTKARWMPGTHRNSTEHMQAMVAWAEKHFEGKGKDELYIYKGWTCNFYFSNPADAMIMKLTWGDDIENTDRIKLIGEINDEEDQSE
jgi:hypothetical protein